MKTTNSVLTLSFLVVNLFAMSAFGSGSAAPNSTPEKSKSKFENSAAVKKIKKDVTTELLFICETPNNTGYLMVENFSSFTTNHFYLYLKRYSPQGQKIENESIFMNNDDVEINGESSLFVNTEKTYRAKSEYNYSFWHLEVRTYEPFVTDLSISLESGNGKLFHKKEVWKNGRHTNDVVKNIKLANCVDYR